MRPSKDQTESEKLGTPSKAGSDLLSQTAQLQKALNGTIENLRIHQEELRAQNDALKEAQWTIEASQKKYLDLFELAPIGYFLFDESTLVVDLNLAAARLLNLERHHVIGKPLLVYVDDESRAKLASHFRLVFSGRRASGEVTIKRPDGKTIPALIESSPLPDLPGEKARCVTAIFDIHERKEAEVRSHEAQTQAEAANKAKTAFMANMSHELRTPLNAIIGFTEVMQSETLGPIGVPRYKEYLGDVAFSAKHLLGVINDVLDITKIEADKLEMHFEDVEPLEVLDTALAMVKDSAQRGSINLKPVLPKSLPLMRADKRRLLQILINLLSNAIKFTPAGGTVTLTANTSVKNQLTVVVDDTGIGVKPYQIPLIMQPFGQVDSELSRRFDGTGLGLPLARFLTERHGGTLTFESQPGIGSKVTLAFPL